MKRIGDVIYGADKQISGWVESKIPGYTATDGARALGVIKGAELVAGITYENWNGIHVESAIAALPGSRWADRRVLRAIFHYPFIGLGCRAVSVSVPMSNLASLNLATKLGFEPEAIVRFAAHDGSDLLILKAFKEKCRWIVQDGKKRRKPTPPGPV